jgi:Flp pilus assembly protein TadG
MRADSSARRSWQDERGQTFVFVLTILFALFLIVAMSVNIGQAVNRRIMLQIAADAGAFTGASEMARGMNTIAEVNLRIQRAWAAMATS